MTIKELITQWSGDQAARMTEQEYRVRLPFGDAARIEALAEMYPHKGVEGIITDLLGAALDELEAALPYRAGERQVAEDEFGDPIYEDAGPTPRFHRLVQAHARRLQGNEQ
ncbi:type 1 pili tip component [Ectothiorhodospiraceae bacterium 2226]|nr:type 1 pili tip component [Ectothiorhodospiraceae bacterium 2226]